MKRSRREGIRVTVYICEREVWSGTTRRDRIIWGGGPRDESRCIWWIEDRRHGSSGLTIMGPSIGGANLGLKAYPPDDVITALINARDRGTVRIEIDQKRCA